MVRLTNLHTPFSFQFNVDVAGTPEQLSVKLKGTTIAFNDNGAAPDTITDSGSGFLKAGFQPGDTLQVSGSASNNTVGPYYFTIATVTAGTITLLAKNALTTEAAGATVKLVAAKNVPDGIGVTIKAKYANTDKITIADSSEKAVYNSGGNFGLRNNESVGLQVVNTMDVWLDAAVSGEGVEVLFEKQTPSNL